MRNGANGTSLFIVRFFRRKGKKFRAPPSDLNLESAISVTLTTAPIQKPKITPETPKESPRNHPIPKTSLASPNPIHLPPETSQIRKNGRARIGPARRLKRY